MTDDRRSQVVELLEQQKYDEALSILGGLREMDPVDRELQIYHLLVVRILILRWNLTGAAAKRAFLLRAKIQRTIKRGVSLICVTREAKVIPLLRRVHQTIGTRVVPRGVKRIIALGAGMGLCFMMLIFYSHIGRSLAVPAPAKMVTAILALDSTVSASDAKPYVEDKFTFAEEAGRLTPRLATVGAVNLLSAPQSISRELATTGHVKDVAGQVALNSGTQPVKVVTTDPIRSGGVTSAQPAKPSGHTEKPIKITGSGNNRNKTPRKSLGYYRSLRAIPIRTLPRFAAPAVREIDSGVSLAVLEFVGSWAQVELKSAGVSGFVRREFLVPSEEHKSNATLRPSSGN